VSVPEVLIHLDGAALAEAVAVALLPRLAAAQEARGVAHLSVTGGDTGIACLAAVAASPERDTVDWARVHVWWGDERFVSEDHEDRNEVQAREALLDHVPLDPAKLHPMPSTDSGLDVDAAAALYAEQLRRASGPDDHALVPSFDVTLLGVGPDSHVNSLFPGLPAVHETERWVVGVHGSPKPPPLRVTLTFPAVRASREVWLVVHGADKAEAIAAALSVSDPINVPASGARGRERTLVFLDEGAASALPPELRA
jgi:6-phosphogluconolactonase